MKSARRIANFNVPPPDSGGTGDTPIIVQGGNSVHVIVPDKFSEDGTSKKGGKFTHGTGTLTELVIDGGTPIALNSNSVIEIRYN